MNAKLTYTDNSDSFLGVRQAANVGRYVYHLTQKHNRKSILKDGLRGGTNQKLDYQQAVFAHDADLLTGDWFYVMDMVNFPTKSRQITTIP